MGVVVGWRIFCLFRSDVQKIEIVVSPGQYRYMYVIVCIPFDGINMRLSPVKQIERVFGGCSHQKVSDHFTKV